MAVEDIGIYILIGLYVLLLAYIGKRRKAKGIKSAPYNANHTITGTDIATNPAYSSLGCNIHNRD